MRRRILIQSVVALIVFAVAFMAGQAQCGVAKETL